MRSRTVSSSSITSTGRRRPGRLPASSAAIGSALARPSGRPDRASAGRRIVKVEPCPGSLATVMSPPIMRQKRRLIASPRPVPPYLRVVEASAWVNSSKSRHLLGRHADSRVRDRHRDPVAGRRRPRGAHRDPMRPRSVNLLALLARLSSALAEPRRVGLHPSHVGGDSPPRPGSRSSPRAAGSSRPRPRPWGDARRTLEQRGPSCRPRSSRGRGCR